MPSTLTIPNVNNIGDVSLEQVIKYLDTQTTPFVPFIFDTSQYKKDYFSIPINDPVTRITQYGVYALFFNNMTYVITAVNKRDFNKTIITCDTSKLDPTQIVDNAYMSQTNTKRTILQKKVIAQDINPYRLMNTYNFFDSTAVNPNPTLIKASNMNRIDADNQYTMWSNLLTIKNIDPVLVNLNIIIKNGDYISLTDFATLNAIITIMMTF
jgi:hypothetical protein